MGLLQKLLSRRTNTVPIDTPRAAEDRDGGFESFEAARVAKAFPAGGV